MNETQRMGLKFAATALKEAVDNAKKTGKVKYYPRGVVAIKTNFLNVDKTIKAAIMKIVLEHDLGKYTVLNVEGKKERSILIDMKKVAQILNDNFEEIEGNAANGGLALRRTTRQGKTRG